MANVARGIDAIHNLITFIERKQTGVYHSHEEIDAALNAGQLEFVKESYKNKDYDALDLIKVSGFALTSDTVGKVTYPSDFLYQLTVFAGTLPAPIPIREVEEDELPDAILSQLRPISTAKPIYVDTARGITIFPQTVYPVILYYFRLPATPKYGYLQTGRVITYDPTSSTQLEFYDIFIDRIIAKALAYLGINTSEDDVIKFGQIENVAA